MAVGGAVIIDFEYQQINDTDMEEQIESAVTAKKHFYVGVAKENGTALESLYRREGRVLSQNGNWSQTSSHHADIKATGASFNLKPEKVFYTELLNKKDACALESFLITDRLKKPFCINIKSGEDECFQDQETKQGIVYVRVYKG